MRAKPVSWLLFLLLMKNLEEYSVKYDHQKARHNEIEIDAFQIGDECFSRQFWARVLSMVLTDSLTNFIQKQRDMCHIETSICLHFLDVIIIL